MRDVKHASIPFTLHQVFDFWIPDEENSFEIDLFDLFRFDSVLSAQRQCLMASRWLLIDTDFVLFFV